MVPVAQLYPRGTRARLASAGTAFADGVKRAVRLVTDVVGALFGV